MDTKLVPIYVPIRTDAQEMGMDIFLAAITSVVVEKCGPMIVIANLGRSGSAA
jgi:hypothetical protein